MRRRTATPKKVDETPEKVTRRSRRGRGRSTPEEPEEDVEQQNAETNEVENTSMQVEVPEPEEEPKRRGRRAVRVSSSDSNPTAKGRRGRAKREPVVEETIQEEPVQEKSNEQEEEPLQQETIISNGEESSKDVEPVTIEITESNEAPERSYVELEPVQQEPIEEEQPVAEESNEVPEPEQEQEPELIQQQVDYSNQADDSVDAPDADIVEIQKSPDDTITQEESVYEPASQGTEPAQEDCEDGEIIEDAPKQPSPEPIPRRQRRKFITHSITKANSNEVQEDPKDENADNTKTVSNKWSSDDTGRSNTEVSNKSNEIKSPRKKDEPKAPTDETNHKDESIQKPPIQRKRKWITQKSTDNKPAIISISTDSLKNLIPEVKPVPLSDIKLDVSPEIEVLSEQEPEQQQEHNRKRKISDHNGDQMENLKPKRKVTVTQDHQKHHANDEQTATIQNKTSTSPPSPAKQTQSSILYITNLVRPFTVLQLKGLLARTGKIVENGFWIDKIKSRCYVKYEKEDEAVETRHALHGVRWPASNPKCLNVDFGRDKDMEKAIISTLDEGTRQTVAVAETSKETSGFGWTKAEAYRTEYEEKASRDSTHRPVREWDLGKRDEKENDEDRRHKEDRRRRDRDRERERERRRSRDRSGSDRRERRRSRSASGSRKPRKTDNEPPIRLLDDLFRKTKSTPCIYWLPLTIEQIAEREELRRKRIEEQERQLEEMRKAREERQKERERERLRRKSRSPSRNRDRRRRSRSARSNSRSRSRSRDNRRRFNR